MKSKALYLIYIFPILFLLSLAACDDMDDYSSDPKHTLWFSQDTLRMDTVLTGIPTSTRQLKVYNPHKKALLISSIILADAGKSGFRINVDGIRGDQFSDIEIAGEDSLYIFAVPNPYLLNLLMNSFKIYNYNTSIKISSVSFASLSSKLSRNFLGSFQNSSLDNPYSSNTELIASLLYSAVIIFIHFRYSYRSANYS